MFKLIGRARSIRHAQSFGIYGVGVAALCGADILISSVFDPTTISNWAEVRSLFGITGILCVVGLDQMFMRSPNSSAKLIRLLSVQIPTLALVIGACVVLAGYMESWVAATALVSGAALSQALSQYFRSHGLLVQAQVTQQAWKIVILVVLAGVAASGGQLDIDRAASGIIFGASLIGALMLLRYGSAQASTTPPEGKSALYATGSRFMVTSLFLAMAMYAEQLLVNGVGSVDEGAKYFAHSTYFFFPASAVIGYIGFVLGPWMRNNHDAFVANLKVRAGLVVVAAGAFAVAMNCLGRAAWHLLDPTVGRVDLALQLILLANCFSAALYTIPSAYNGIFARAREHDILIAAQVASLAIAAGAFCLLYYALDWRLVHSVALAGAVNWALRVSAGFWVTYRISGGRSTHG